MDWVVFYSATWTILTIRCQKKWRWYLFWIVLKWTSSSLFKRENKIGVKTDFSNIVHTLCKTRNSVDENKPLISYCEFMFSTYFLIVYLFSMLQSKVFLKIFEWLCVRGLFVWWHGYSTTTSLQQPSFRAEEVGSRKRDREAPRQPQPEVRKYKKRLALFPAVFANSPLPPFAFIIPSEDWRPIRFIKQVRKPMALYGIDYHTRPVLMRKHS